ncbi:hypothetical protein H4Q32_026857 [Labeo rohita]|uniref:Uncharacterized protein n=1 Tax=Labeo rohita TaxID=84645 RepID=A0ABQ8L5L9_LABRO|nr:hypothetical protein H4Q32_026857 [Labeo rohita]
MVDARYALNLTRTPPRFPPSSPMLLTRNNASKCVFRSSNIVKCLTIINEQGRDITTTYTNKKSDCKQQTEQTTRRQTACHRHWRHLGLKHAILSVWATHCAPEASSVHKSAPEASSVHESAPEASSVPEFAPIPPEVSAKAVEPPTKAASSYELSSHHVMAKEANHELSACHVTAKEAYHEPTACHVTAKEAKKAKENFYELSAMGVICSTVDIFAPVCSACTVCPTISPCYACSACLAMSACSACPAMASCFACSTRPTMAACSPCSTMAPGSSKSNMADFCSKVPLSAIAPRPRPSSVFYGLLLFHGPDPPRFHCLPQLHGPGPLRFHCLLLFHGPGPPVLHCSPTLLDSCARSRSQRGGIL